MYALVFAAAAGLFILRSSFLVPAGKFRLPQPWEEALRHARPAVLAAMLVSSVAGGGPTSTPDVVALIVVAVALLVSSKLDMAWTVAVGLVTIAVIGLIGF